MFGLTKQILQLRIESARDPPQRSPEWFIGPCLQTGEGGGAKAGFTGEVVDRPSPLLTQSDDGLYERFEAAVIYGGWPPWHGSGDWQELRVEQAVPVVLDFGHLDVPVLVGLRERQRQCLQRQRVAFHPLVHLKDA